MATPFCVLVLPQLPIKRRKVLKALLRNAFKTFLLLGLSAKRFSFVLEIVE